MVKESIDYCGCCGGVRRKRKESFVVTDLKWGIELGEEAKEHGRNVCLLH